MGLLAPEVYQAQPNSVAVYVRHRPETTLLYQVIREYWPEFQAELASQNKYLPAYVVQEFEAYLKCGILEHGFLRVRCETCQDERLVAFSCKRRGFCDSCGARRMADSAALLVDDILPHKPMRQLSPGMACIRAMQEQLPPGMEVRGVSICPGTDGIRAMQEQLPRTRKLCRGCSACPFRCAFCLPATPPSWARYWVSSIGPLPRI